MQVRVLTVARWCAQRSQRSEVTGAGGFLLYTILEGREGGEEETCGDEWKGWIMGKNVNNRTYEIYQQEQTGQREGLPEKMERQSAQSLEVLH